MGVVLARYTTDFDCGYETEWWWLIKDDPMDIGKLKAKRRNNITRGLKNCEIRKISPKVYAEQIYFVYIAAFQNYKKAGKASSKESFITQCLNHEKDSHIEYYGAFLKDNGELVGYSLNYVFEDWVDLSTLKFSPEYLSEQVSAALIYVMLYDYLNTQYKKCERSIRHVTNFQDYPIMYLLN